MPKRTSDGSGESHIFEKKKVKKPIIDLCDDSDSDINNNDNESNFITFSKKKESSNQNKAQGGKSVASSSFSSFSAATAAKSKSKSTSSSKNTKIMKTPKSKKQYKIFCDLDGVLVDFDKGVLSLFPNHKHYKSTSDIPPHILWPRINNSSSTFFRDLSWTKDGLELWKTLLELYVYYDHVVELSILTGCPRNQSSKSQKFEWCQRHLDIDVNDIRSSKSSSSSDSVVVDDDGYGGGGGGGGGGIAMRNGSRKDNMTRILKLTHVDKAAKKSQHQIVRSKNTKPTGMKSITSMFQPKKTSSSSSKGCSSSASTSYSLSQPSTTITVQKQINIITCWSKNKHYESKQNHILIDDRIKLRDEWTAKGGIFIHHTCTRDTIRQLTECGIIQKQ